MTEINELTELGIDFNVITQKLLGDGVESFAKSFQSLMSSIKNK